MPVLTHKNCSCIIPEEPKPCADLLAVFNPAIPLIGLLTMMCFSKPKKMAGCFPLPIPQKPSFIVCAKRHTPGESRCKPKRLWKASDEKKKALSFRTKTEKMNKPIAWSWPREVIAQGTA